MNHAVPTSYSTIGYRFDAVLVPYRRKTSRVSFLRLCKWPREFHVEKWFDSNVLLVHSAPTVAQNITAKDESIKKPQKEEIPVAPKIEDGKPEELDITSKNESPAAPKIDGKDTSELVEKATADMSRRPDPEINPDSHHKEAEDTTDAAAKPSESKNFSNAVSGSLQLVMLVSFAQMASSFFV